MAAQKKQGAHRCTNHVAQEAVGRDFKIPRMVGSLHPFACSDGAQRGLVVGTALADCCEILMVRYPFGSFCHELVVERVGGLVGVVT